MFSANDIALWFVLKNNSKMKENEAENDEYEVYEGITHLKLQKLIYYAQGVYLAITGQKLFFNDIEAWTHGPVVPEVYDEYKKYGKGNISNITLTEEQEEIITDIEIDRETSEILNMVYDNFAIYTAWQLREMSHVKNGPWDKAIKNGNTIIDTDDINEYFTKEIVADV